MSLGVFNILQQQQHRMASNNDDHYNDSSHNGDFDAFAFLHEEQDLDAVSGGTITSSTTRSQPQQQQQRQGIGGFLKKMAVHTGAQIERSMQTWAVKIDQGKNADLIRVAMYDPITFDVLGVTETRPYGV